LVSYSTLNYDARSTTHQICSKANLLSWNCNISGERIQFPALTSSWYFVSKHCMFAKWHRMTRFHRLVLLLFLGVFTSVANSAYWLYHACPSVCLHVSSWLPLMHIHHICYWGLLWKSSEKLQICVKLVKNIRHFMGRPKYFYIVDGTTKYFVAWQ